LRHYEIMENKTKWNDDPNFVSDYAKAITEEAEI
jgi:hypothetical protein